MSSVQVRKHFVTFYSPGTFVAETTEFRIDSWDVRQAVAMSKGIKERYGTVPYGFRFSTRARGPEDLDSKVVESSGMYYLGGKIETLQDLIRRNDPKEKILRSNMIGNKWDRVVTTTRGWKWTQPLEPGDVVLDLDGRTEQPTRFGARLLDIGD